MSAFPSHSAPPSSPSCDLAPAAPPVDASSGALWRALPPLFCLDGGRRGECFPGLGPCVPARLRQRPPPRSDWLSACACSEASGPGSPPRPSPSPPRPFSARVRKMPAAVTGCGGPAPRVLRFCRRHYGAPSGEFADRWCLQPSASRVARVGAAGWWRRPRPRASHPELQPRRSFSASAATEPSRQLHRCLHFGSASPPPFVHALHRRLPASLSLLFFSPCCSAVWARVSELLALLARAAPALLLLP